MILVLAWSLRSQLVLSSVCVSVLGLALGLVFIHLFESQTLIWPLLLITAACALLLSLYLTRHLARSMQALETGLLNLKDNDFSVRLPLAKTGSFAPLFALFNDVSGSLRQERQFIYQRELLLDKVIQSATNVMLLVDDRHKIIYANDAAKHFFFQGQPLIGLSLDVVLESQPQVLIDAVNEGREGLFSWQPQVQQSADIETWHLSRGRFSLNGQYHHLLLLKQMTKELDRQEVKVWKKVIRIISHELNNSVAPINSMVNSGKLITQEMNNSQLNLIFDTIADRCQHLSQFISDYSRFAKLSLPQKQAIDWHKFTAQLQHYYAFELGVSLPEKAGFFDLIQMEQVLLNLLKNAHESGSAPTGIRLFVHESVLNSGRTGVEIIIEDQGCGMSEEVLKQALLPFYSTKQAGTGLGLPLCREIVEAHDGMISIQNRTCSGLKVTLWLPDA